MAKVAGVSVIPVIEALKQLEEDGLVESKVKWGSFVTIITPEKVKDMFVLREAVECQVARILSENMTQEQEMELRKIADELDHTDYTSDTSKQFNSNHYHFHNKMVEFTGYNSLIQALRRVNLFWLLCKGASITRQNSSNFPEGWPNNWHKKIINAIASHDANAAQEVMRIHIRHSYDAIMEEIEKKHGNF